MDATETLICLALKNKGDWNEIFADLKGNNHVTKGEEIILVREAQAVRDEGYEIITLMDGNYPWSLKSSHKPPFALFCKGDASLLEDRRGVSCAGRFSEAKEISKKLSCTIATLFRDGEGQEIIRFTNGRRKLDVALCPHKSSASAHAFLIKLLGSIFGRVALLDGVDDDDAMALTRVALENGCDVYAKPTKGPSVRNSLIKDGACLYDSPDDIDVGD